MSTVERMPDKKEKKKSDNSQQFHMLIVLQLHICKYFNIFKRNLPPNQPDSFESWWLGGVITFPVDSRICFGYALKTVTGSHGTSICEY